MNGEWIRDPWIQTRRAPALLEWLGHEPPARRDPWRAMVRCALVLGPGAVERRADRRHLPPVVLPSLLLRNHGYRPTGNTFLTPECAQPFGPPALHGDRCSTCCAQLGLHFCPVRRQLRRLAHH